MNAYWRGWLAIGAAVVKLLVTVVLLALLVLTLLVLLVDALAAEPFVLAGMPRVVDGDTLELDGQRIRLAGGVDTPELAQLCRRASGAEYHCGARALVALEDFLAGRRVVCRGEDRDRYGRLLARCQVGGVDLGGWLVAQGWGVVDARYGTEHLPQEAAARGRRLGLWAGTFERPAEWRRRGRRP
jgi:endonuclease YncB( thermonuclease family)